jgi:methylmalonyl-CoA mutase cobalamin-binding subunit
MLLKNEKGTIIIGATESDTHVVSLYLAAFMLEKNGYAVINRVCQNPVAELLAPAPDNEEVLAYIICNQNGHAAEDLKDLLHYKSPNSPVILGGHYCLGCHDMQAQERALSRFGVDFFADSLDDLLPMLERIEETNNQVGSEYYDVA